MNEEQLLRRLASAARNDVPPTVDVSDDVLGRLRARGRPPRTDWLLWSYAATTAAAATFVAVWASQWLIQQQTAALDFLGPAMRAMP